MKKVLVNFHIGRGGRFNNQGYLTFAGVGFASKNISEEQNFIAYENEQQILEKINNSSIRNMAIDLITDLDQETEGDSYADFCNRFGDLGGLVLNSQNGNYIGDYKSNDDVDNYYYDEDGAFDTTYGMMIESPEELNQDQLDAIEESSIDYEFYFEFPETNPEDN